MIKMKSDNREFILQRINSNNEQYNKFSISVYQIPGHKRIYETHHTTDDVFVCGAHVFYTLLALIKWLQRLDFNRCK